MEIGTLSVQDFRNLAPLRSGFHPRLNLLVGANGQGKTNVLESLALVSGRPSFRTADLGDVVREGAAEAAVSVRLADDPDRPLGVRVCGGRREHAFDGRTIGRLEAARKLPVVFLTAADLRRLSGPPADRRRALDRVVVAREPRIAAELRRYEKARAERIALLTAPGRPDRDALAAFEEILAVSGAEISLARRAVLPLLENGLAEAARLLGAPFADLGLRLASELPADGARGELAETLRRGLRAREEAERRAGRALFGPHRDDVLLCSGPKPLAARASSGQARSLVLAWALAETALLGEVRGDRPVLAFDDFDSEWDPAVLALFAEALPDEGQVFLTSARESVARRLPLPEGAVFSVAGGALTPAGPLHGRGRRVPPAVPWPAERSEHVLAS